MSQGLAADALPLTRFPRPLVQWAHFLAWPVLGTGVLLAMSPSHDQMAASVQASGLADAQQLAAARAAANEQLAAIRDKAAESKPFKPSV